MTSKSVTCIRSTSTPAPKLGELIQGLVSLAECIACAVLPEHMMYSDKEYQQTTHAKLTDYGGGWILNELGRSAEDINDLSEIQPEGYFLPKYNMKDLTWNEVLIHMYLQTGVTAGAASPASGSRKMEPVCVSNLMMIMCTACTMGRTSTPGACSLLPISHVASRGGSQQPLLQQRPCGERTSSSSSHHSLLGRGWFSCQGLLPW